MGHVPTIGRDVFAEKLGPQPEVLGTIKPELTDPKPRSEGASWQSKDGEQIEFLSPPPPWEIEDKRYDGSDARRYVDAPADWTLRWINPKLLDQQGWRYWQAVMPSDPRVKLKIQTMLHVDGTIRRGGQTGDILAWMYTTWVDSRRRLRIKAVEDLSASAVDKQENLREEFARGTYGPYVRMSEAKHPSHTQAEGRSMRD